MTDRTKATLDWRHERPKGQPTNLSPGPMPELQDAPHAPDLHSPGPIGGQASQTPGAPKPQDTPTPIQSQGERLASLEGRMNALEQQNEPGRASPSKEPVLYAQALAKLIDALALYSGYQGTIDPELAGLIILLIEGLALVVSRAAVTPNAKLGGN